MYCSASVLSFNEIIIIVIIIVIIIMSCNWTDAWWQWLGVRDFRSYFKPIQVSFQKYLDYLACSSAFP